jgi:hypothetical protein
MYIIDPMGWISPEARELFNLFAEQQAEQRRQELSLVTSSLQTLPASAETLERLCALSPHDAQRALRDHPGYKTQRNLESIETMLEVFHRALADLDIAVSAFPPLGPPDGRSERESLETEVSVRVNKEILAAISASQALVDYSRRAREFLPSNLYDQKLHEIFDDDEHALVKGLRNLLSHLRHTKADWETTYSQEGRATRFKIKTEVLLAEAELSSGARRSLATHGQSLDISNLLSEYAKRVDSFYGWLLPELEHHLPQAVVEFRRCEEAVELHHTRQSFKLLLGLWRQANVDPYVHLPMHLTGDQLVKALELPQRSKAQVDYIIFCVDRNGVCDEELRQLVYGFFQITDRNIVE